MTEFTVSSNQQHKENAMKKVLAGVSLALAATVMSLTGQASATAPPTITVDGVTYPASKITPGAAIHYETPDVDPESASETGYGLTWTGNGSDNLPCEGGIHWIANGNVLTISHCLGDPGDDTTTTTTEPDDEETTTTTSVPEEETTTTVTVPEEETTTTVTVPEEENTTTLPPVTERKLPDTGNETWIMALLGGLALSAGAGLTWLTRRS